MSVPTQMTIPTMQAIISLKCAAQSVVIFSNQIKRDRIAAAAVVVAQTEAVRMNRIQLSK